MRLSVNNLACERGERRIFEGVSFTLQAGEALVITGRNGAGKSSLLDILAGRLHPASGAILLDGAGERTLAECLHYVGHRDALKAALTAEENLTFARDFLGNPALKPRDALEAVGLAHAARLPVAYLSAGQRRRVALARLLVAHRPLWLLDEPTSALDTASQEILRLILESHRENGGMIAASTHAPLFLGNAKEIRIERTKSPPPSAGEGAERSEAGEGQPLLSHAPSPGPAGHPLPYRGKGKRGETQ
ncbi:heme ABC exporter ATP-binding protein CcmA [Microvirga sp. CF3062]|uniref:heme ABC exporter ATP-binding protein CcmA n=1 Tax=Microvirga sp. CF3062 TaxID=3110182 RepID=UPI002E784C2F|nr:heme ABC exporter ATP-binding protein CcmA [Microvirga sp. CF3062]MEE1656581.1 heme ABC exporter ATP-binding protein CcmA [Microvirga sp. CF3062]